MSVFSYEWKKLMVVQRGLFYILAALLVSTVWLAANDSPPNSAMEDYREEYEWYLERLDGTYTEEKAAWLERETWGLFGRGIRPGHLCGCRLYLLYDLPHRTVC